jgi:hypothetical protein
MPKRHFYYTYFLWCIIILLVDEFVIRFGGTGTKVNVGAARETRRLAHVVEIQNNEERNGTNRTSVGYASKVG